MAKRIAVIIRDRERQYEGLRTSLGLLLERHVVAMYVLDHEIELTDEFLDNMSFIDEMGGARYSNHPVNVERHGFRPISLDALAHNLQAHDVVIPF